MTLPGVNITLGNGSLGGQNASQDGTTGMILTGVTVSGSGNVTVATPYSINSVDEAIAIGITESGSNHYAYHKINNFYKTAKKGTTLLIMLVTAATSMEDMADKNKLFGPVLLDASQGKIRLLGFSKKSATGITIANGVDADVDKAMIKAQELAEAYALEHKPFRFVVDGKDWNGTAGDLKDYRTATYNRGSILLGASQFGKNASVGLFLGVVSSLPVQRKASRVRNGALAISEGYTTDGKQMEESESAWGVIHDKGYIILRKFANKSGIYFSSDTTATSLTDDYSSLSRGRVIDKAHVIAYSNYVEYIDDEIEVDEEGKLDTIIVKGLENGIETAIELQMLANGEASNVEAIIPLTQNILSTPILNIELKVTPVGYLSTISILLGFNNPAIN